MTVSEILTIEMLADSELALHERVQRLQHCNEQLVAIVADLAFDRAVFETLTRGWIQELSASRQTADRLREELRRYTSARV